MTSQAVTLRIATRASQLALWQALHVSQLLQNLDENIKVELVEVSTHGDRDRIEPLTAMGGVGVFTREVQRAVLDGRADLAVHSLKDLPTESAPGLKLAGVPDRAPRFDVLVLPHASNSSLASLDHLPSGARIGTGSLRRQAQLLHHRSDLEMVDIRGNVETRLRKLDEDEYDAIVLAEAGLKRLGLDRNRPLVTLSPPAMYPAVGQAALGIECRQDDEQAIDLLHQISDESTYAEVTAERACLHALRAGCHAPVGTLARIEDETLTLQGVVLSTDGGQRIEEAASGPVDDAADVGCSLAQQLLDCGAQALINSQ